MPFRSRGGQTISQPFIVARMTELLGLTGQEKVLEIGAGSGYQTAVLASLARKVLLLSGSQFSPTRLIVACKCLDFRNFTLKAGDGHGRMGCL